MSDRPDFPGPLTIPEIEAHLDGIDSIGAHGHTPEAMAQIAAFQKWRHEERARLINEEGRRARMAARQAVLDQIVSLTAGVPVVTLVKSITVGGRGFARINIEPSSTPSPHADGYYVRFRPKGTLSWRQFGAKIMPDALPRSETITFNADTEQWEVAVAVSSRSGGDYYSNHVSVSFGRQARAEEAQRAAEAARIAHERDEAQKRAREAAEKQQAEREAANRARREQQERENAAHAIEAAKRRAANEAAYQNFLRHPARLARLREAPPSISVVRQTNRSVLFEIYRHRRNKADRFQLMSMSLDGTERASGASYPRRSGRNMSAPYRTWRRKGSGDTVWWVRGGSKYGHVNSEKVIVPGRS